MKKCSRCQMYGEKAECAFSDGVFSSDNWNCQTMVALRELAGEGTWVPGDGKHAPYFRAWYQWDDNASSIGVFAIPEEVAFADEEMQVGYVVMTWYKSRGTTGGAWVMCDDVAPEKLTLKTAEAILECYTREKRHGTGIVKGTATTPIVESERLLE